MSSVSDILSELSISVIWLMLTLITRVWPIYPAIPDRSSTGRSAWFAAVLSPSSANSPGPPVTTRFGIPGWPRLGRKSSEVAEGVSAIERVCEQWTPGAKAEPHEVWGNLRFSVDDNSWTYQSVLFCQARGAISLNKSLYIIICLHSTSVINILEQLKR